MSAILDFRPRQTMRDAMAQPAYRQAVAHENRRWAREAMRRGDKLEALRIIHEALTNEATR